MRVSFEQNAPRPRLRVLACESAWESGEPPGECGSSGFVTPSGPLVGRLLRTSRRILANEDLAWDAVQEALVSLWQQREPPAQAEAWLVRAVRFRSLHLARTARRRRRHESDACRRRPEASSRDEPGDSASRVEMAVLLAETLEILGEPHRSVLTLLLVEDQDYRSIAQTLKIPIGTVRSRLSRSREALRRQLERIHPEIFEGEG